VLNPIEEGVKTAPIGGFESFWDIPALRARSFSRFLRYSAKSRSKYLCEIKERIQRCKGVYQNGILVLSKASNRQSERDTHWKT
jgi:hypothetical protein